MTSEAEARIRAAVAELADALIASVQAQGASRDPEQLYDVPTAARLCGLGRTRFLTELSTGRIRSIRSGRRVLIPASAISEFAGAGPPPETK